MAMGILEKFELESFQKEVKGRLTALETKHGVEGNGGDTESIETRLTRLEDLVNSINGSVSFIKGQLKEFLKAK